MTLIELGELSGCICATTVTTIHYLTGKVLGNEHAKQQVENLLGLFEIASVGRLVIEEALKSKFTDFEDAVIYQAAYHAGADGIVTRDYKGLKKSKLPVYNPIELLNILRAIE